MKNALYIGNFGFPDRNASGKRVYGNGKLLREIGFETIFVGVDRQHGKLDKLENTKDVYDGFEFYSLPYPSGMSWANYKPVIKTVENFILNYGKLDKLDLVILYGSPTLSIFVTRIIGFCKKNNIRVLIDYVDWLSSNYGPIFYDLVKALDTRYQKRIAYKKADGIIAISSYLADFYSKQGKEVVIIPPLNINKNSVPKKKSDEPSIVYAGFWPHQKKKAKNCNNYKDRIDLTVELLARVKKLGGLFVFNVYGLTKDCFQLLFPNKEEFLNILGDSIQFHGVVDNQLVQKAVSAAAYTILLRNRTRDTMAGFPTKISESIGCGTPVITTDTSDIWRYISEADGNLLVSINELDDAALKIKNGLEIASSTNSLNNPFYFLNYVDTFSSFIMRIDKHC